MRKPASSPCCLREAIEKDEDFLPWDEESETGVVPLGPLQLATPLEDLPRDEGVEESRVSEANTGHQEKIRFVLSNLVQDPGEKRERRKRVQTKIRPRKRQRVYPPSMSVQAPRAVPRELKIERRSEQVYLLRRRRHKANLANTERFKTHSDGRYFPLERKSATMLSSPGM